MRRFALAIISIAMFTSGLALLFVVADQGWNEFMGSVLLKVGIVLGLFWLAYDQVMHIADRTPAWLIGLILLSVGILVVRPKAIFVLAPVLAAIAALQFISGLFKPLPPVRRSSDKAAKTTKRPQK